MALRAIAIENWLSMLAVLSGLVVVVFGIRALRRWSAGRRVWQGALGWLGGCSMLLLYVAIAAVFVVCRNGEIGESGKNRLARAYGEPVIAALEGYRRDSGAYPRSLDSLVPRYLTRASLRAPEVSVLRHPFEYRADSGRFELLVQFSGPGMNECCFRPGTAWRCGRYF